MDTGRGGIIVSPKLKTIRETVFLLTSLMVCLKLLLSANKSGITETLAMYKNPPAVAGITKSAPVTLVPKKPFPLPKTTAAKSIPLSECEPETEPPVAPALSAMIIPRKVPTNAPTAVKNCDPMA